MSDLQGLPIGQRHQSYRVFSGVELTVGATAPTMVHRAPYNVPEFTIADDCSVQWPVPNDWHYNSDFVVWFRWGCNEAYGLANGEVRWQYLWEAVPNDMSEAIGAPTHTGTGNTGDINIPAVANTVTEVQLLCTITGAAAALVAGDTIGLNIERIALVAGVNPTAEPYILTVGVDYASHFPTYSL